MSRLAPAFSPAPRTALPLLTLVGFLAVLLPAAAVAPPPSPDAHQPDAGGASAGQIDYADAATTGARAIVLNQTTSVSFLWEASKFQFDDMDRGFRRANSLLYDVSDGQVVYKTVHLYWNRNNQGGAHFVVENTPGFRAYTIRCGLFFGGQTHLGRDSQGAAYDSSFGASTIIHEWSHYAFCLPDEYDDTGGGSVPRENNVCLLADGFTSEWCTDANHLTAPPGQEAKSAWQQVVDRYGAQGMVETTGTPPSGPFGAPDPTIVWHFPDLKIDPASGLVTPKPVASEGEKLTLTASYVNSEGLLNKEIDFALYDGNPDLGAKVLQTKKITVVGWLVDITFDYTVLPGDHSIYVRADPDGVQEELDENNNTASVKVLGLAKPTIKTNFPKTLTGTEDVPLTTSFVNYEADAEDSGADLDWSVVATDRAAIAGTKVADDGDTVTLTPRLDWNGVTEVQFRLTDSDGLTRDAWSNVTFSAVNDIPVVSELVADLYSLFRGEQTAVHFKAVDVETPAATLTPTAEYKPVKDLAWWPLTVAHDGLLFSGTFQPTLAEAADSYDLRAMVRDADGGESPYLYANGSVLVGNNLPTAGQLEAAPELLPRGQDIQFRLTVADTENRGDKVRAEFEVSPNGADLWGAVGIPSEEPNGEPEPKWDFAGGEWELTQRVGIPWETGPYDLRGRAVDADGGPSDWITVDEAFLVQNVLPQVLTVTPLAEEVKRTDRVVIEVTGTDLESPAETLVLDLEYKIGKGKYTATGLSKPAYDAAKKKWSVTYTPKADSDTGDAVFRATLEDADGGTSPAKESAFVKVLNNLPVATAKASPARVQVGAAVLFESTGSSDVETPTPELRYEWEFGDGQKSTVAKPRHSYQRAGTFTAKLTVTDKDNGATTTTVTVRVDPAPLGVGPGGGGSTGVIVAGVLGAVIGGLLLMFLLRKRRQAQLEGSPPPGPPASGPEVLPPQ